MSQHSSYESISTGELGKGEDRIANTTEIIIPVSCNVYLTNYIKQECLLKATVLMVRVSSLIQQ